MPKRCLVASNPVSSTPTSMRLTLKPSQIRAMPVGHATLFLVKVAALETVRRFSRARCPFVWCGLQALQVLCYPPVKWVQKWAPFKGLIKSMQTLSRPLLVLSIATAFFDQSESVTSDAIDGSHVNDSRASSESNTESPRLQDSPTACIPDEVSQMQSPKNTLCQLHTELENQGISLPERINEDELHRFFIAANGDFSCFLSSVKKTIRWRETYNILQGQELEVWSNMVYWHGVDVEHQPCLIVRLGLACISVSSHERPRFIQAIVSQVEHGILHLVEPEKPRITVLVDCEGLSPLRFPMQMMRSCSSLLQDHFPNRLGYLFVIRLPPFARVVAQTFFQVLKPVTRQKLKVEGQMYKKALVQYIQTLPLYLGGNCSCKSCSNISISEVQHRVNGGINESETEMDNISVRDLPSVNPIQLDDMDMNGNCDQVLRTAVVGILMIWITFAFIAGIYDPGSRPFSST